MTGPATHAGSEGSASDRPLLALRLSITLPVVWGVGCLLGFADPGDEYALWAVGSMLGTWTALLFPVGHPQDAVAPTLVVGCALMWGFGYLLQRQRVPAALWLGAWVAAGAAFFLALHAAHADHAAAVQKHGSTAAFVACASQLGSYAATVVAGLIVAGSAMMRSREGRSGSAPAGELEPGAVSETIR